MKRLLSAFATTWLFASLAFAAPPKNFAEREKQALRIRPETSISIVFYDKASDTFVVKINAEPAVGPNITTLEWLLEGIDAQSNLKEYKRHPSRLVGGQFQLKKKLWLLSDEEIAARKAKRAPKKR